MAEPGLSESGEPPMSGRALAEARRQLAGLKELYAEGLLSLPIYQLQQVMPSHRLQLHSLEIEDPAATVR